MGLIETLPKDDRQYFSEINDELADKGFLVTSAESLITWARTGSLMWMTFGLACCAVEMMQMSMPRYDAERFGFAPRASDQRTLQASRAAFANGLGFDPWMDRMVRAAGFRGPFTRAAFPPITASTSPSGQASTQAPQPMHQVTSMCGCWARGPSLRSPARSAASRASRSRCRRVRTCRNTAPLRMSVKME